MLVQKKVGKTHIISLLSQFSKEEVELMVFEEGAIAREARNLGIQVHVLPNHLGTTYQFFQK